MLSDAGNYIIVFLLLPVINLLTIYIHPAPIVHWYNIQWTCHRTALTHADVFVLNIPLLCYKSTVALNDRYSF